MEQQQPDHITRTRTKAGNTSLTMRELDSLDSYEDIRRVLGLDLPVDPIAGRVRTCNHPDPDEWLAQQEKASRNSDLDDATLGYFRRVAIEAAQDHKESLAAMAIDNITAPVADDRILSIGEFAAELEIRKVADPNTIYLFHAALFRQSHRMLRRSQLVSLWNEQHPDSRV